VARSQNYKNPKLTTKPLIKAYEEGSLKNKTAEGAPKKIIIEHSTIKIKVNVKPPCSILSPETGSDSSSEKSKGVRLVSATYYTSHKIKRNGQTKSDKCLPVISDSTPTDKDLLRSGTLKTISASLIL